MKGQKIKGSGRKLGSTNLINRELKEQLRLHVLNELSAIQSRIDELPLADRYKVAAMLFKLLLPPQTNHLSNEPTIILIPEDI